MWKIIGTFLVLLLFATGADAATRTTLQNAAGAVGNGTNATVDDKGAIGVTVTGTFVGTITFEGSADAATTFSAITCTEVASLLSSTTTTTTGQYQCPIAGLSHFRARISAYTSGSITVVGTASNASLGSAGGGSVGTGTIGSATAAAPTLAEASTGYFSWDLAGNLRITMGTLLAGEDQTNNLLMTSGGAVRSTTMASAVTTDTTSAAVTLPVGTKRIYGSVDGTGAVTQTQKIYGGLTSGVTTTNGELLCTITLSGTTHAHDGCTVTTPHLFYIVVTTVTTGTSATGVVTAMY